VGHLGWGCLLRADYLVGDHKLGEDELDWPITAASGMEFLHRGLRAWRHGLDEMTDADLDTGGRSAYPGGLVGSCRCWTRLVDEQGAGGAHRRGLVGE
jgi:hypothetical protein